jgi:glycosyltransferase involved in cell wall biosynthesis
MRVVFQNDDNRDMFIRRRWVRPQEAVLIPGSGVDTGVFVPAKQANGQPPTVVFPSRMLMTKGLGEFLEAARLLRERGVAARFLLVGEPDPDNPASVTEETLRASAGSAEVEYWGRRDDMHSVMAGADIACLPSYHEGMPKSLLEAAACALPIVTTDVPGCRDVVRHGENGLLVPVRTTHELANALQELIEDPSLRRRMGDRGRERAEAEFSLHHILAAFLRLYGEMLR